MTFPGLLIFLPPKVAPRGVEFFGYRFSRQFVKFPALFNFRPPTPPPPPAGLIFLLIFWTVHDISRTFDFFTPPLKFPLRPPYCSVVDAERHFQCNARC